MEHQEKVVALKVDVDVADVSLLVIHLIVPGLKLI